MNAKKTARQLVTDCFPIEKYQAIQDARKKRMELWKEIGITELIYNEARLIKFGEKVLRYMFEFEVYKALRGKF